MTATTYNQTQADGDRSLETAVPAVHPLIWRDISFTVPVHWEMLQFSRNPDQGRCAFADRYHYRLEVNWRQVDGPPDFDRMLADYSARLEENGMPAGRRIRHGNWHGLEGPAPDCARVSRWGHYDETHKTLLEWVFLWPQDKDVTLETHMLDSVRHIRPESSDVQHWRAFGMDVQVPRNVTLTHCDVRPAHVEWTFQEASTRTEARFSRRGMVDAWLAEPVGDWLRHAIGKLSTNATQRTDTHQNHTVERITGTQRVSHLPGHSRTVVAAAWICPHDRRLYSVVSKHRSMPTDTARLSRLSCCPEFWS